MNRVKLSWVVVALFVSAGAFAGCHRNQSSAPAANSADQSSGAQDQAADPAAANLAPAADEGTGTSSAENVPPPPSASDDSDYNEQPTESAPEPPPALPDYSQPPDPGDGYVWTPGYWNWASSGYYWVPGAWVEPPYSGALWTPGYWGSSSGQYRFYPGHWGSHIGYYGGINYGFGYNGTGYEGGYWNSGHFYANRDYNNINVDKVRNVYSYKVNRQENTSRVSFHGGSNGVQRQPAPQEKAAWREPVAQRMNSQMQHAKSYQSDHGQFYKVNHGQPPNPAESKPVPADRNVHPQMPQPGATQPGRRIANPGQKPAPGQRAMPGHQDNHH